MTDRPDTYNAIPTGQILDVLGIIDGVREATRGVLHAGLHNQLDLAVAHLHQWRAMPGTHPESSLRPYPTWEERKAQEVAP